MDTKEKTIIVLNIPYPMNPWVTIVNSGYTEEKDNHNQNDFLFPFCQACQDFSIRPTTARLDAPAISALTVGKLASSDTLSRKHPAPIPMYRFVTQASET